MDKQTAIEILVDVVLNRKPHNRLVKLQACEVALQQDEPKPAVKPKKADK